MRLEWARTRANVNSSKPKCVRLEPFSIPLKKMMGKRRKRAHVVVARTSTLLRSMLRMKKKLKLFLNQLMNAKKRQNSNAWL